MRAILSRVRLNRKHIVGLLLLMGVVGAPYFVSTGDMEVGALAANSRYITMILGSAMMLAAVVVMVLCPMPAPPKR